MCILSRKSTSYRQDQRPKTELRNKNGSRVFYPNVTTLRSGRRCYRKIIC